MISIKTKKLLKPLLITTAVYSFIFFLLNFSSEVSSGVKNGINLSLNVLIPSMFVFMIFSNIIINSKLKYIISLPFKYLGRKILKLSSNELTVFILSLIAGYPVGAKLLSHEVANNQISSDKAEKMLAFCVNGSPAFLISGVGIGIFSNSLAGIYLFIAQLISCIITAIIMSFLYKKSDCEIKKDNYTKSQMNVSSLFVFSVNDAIKSMVLICGFTIAFSAFMPIVDVVLVKLGNITTIVKGALEITSGFVSINTELSKNPILLASFFTSLCGICVYMQISAIVKISLSGIKKKFSMKWFYIMRPVSITINVIITAVLLNICPITIKTSTLLVSSEIEIIGIENAIFFSKSPISSILLLFLSIILLFFTKKSDRI